MADNIPAIDSVDSRASSVQVKLGLMDGSGTYPDPLDEGFCW